MKITVNGKDETKYIGSPSWTTSDDANGEEMTFTSLRLYSPGAKVKVSDDGTQFYGIIISVEEGNKPPHSYTALDFSYTLKCDEIIQFKKMRADTAIKKLLKRTGIKASQMSVCKIPTKITKIYQDTIINIMTDILKCAKKDQGKSYYFEVRGSKVVIEQKKKVKVKPTFMMADDSAISRSIADVRNEVKLYKDDKTVAKASDTSSIKSLGTLRLVEDAGEISKAKAKAEAQKRLKELNRSTNSKNVTLFVSSGYWDIRKNRLIKLDGGGLKGWYSIKSATHTMDANVHKVSIEVEWHGKL